MDPIDIPGNKETFSQVTLQERICEDCNGHTYPAEEIIGYIATQNVLTQVPAPLFIP